MRRIKGTAKECNAHQSDYDPIWRCPAAILKALHIAYIGLGANIPSRAGSPAETLLAATVALRETGEIVAQSSIYDTEPVGYTEQPRFANAVVSLRTSLSPADLLTRLLAIERSFGRDRESSVPKGPRTLDLDLLFFDDLILHSPDLTVPHPEISHRRFVLEPLAEIAPELVHPESRLTIRELAAALECT